MKSINYHIIALGLSLLFIFSCEFDEVYNVESEGTQLVNVVVPAQISFLPDDTQEISFEIGTTENTNLNVNEIRAFIQLSIAGELSDEIEIEINGGRFQQTRAQLFNSLPINGEIKGVSDLTEGDRWEIRYELDLGDRILMPSKKTFISYACQYNVSGNYSTLSNGEYGDREGGTTGEFEDLVGTVSITRVRDTIFRINDVSFGLFPSEYQVSNPPTAEFSMDCNELFFKGTTLLAAQNNDPAREIEFTVEGVFNPSDRSFEINWSNSDGDIANVQMSLLNNN